MSTYNFKVSISPLKALELVKENMDADLVHEETHDLSKGIYIGTFAGSVQDILGAYIIQS